MTRQEKIDKIRSVCDMMQQYQSEAGYIITLNGETISFIRNLPEDVMVHTTSQSIFLVRRGPETTSSSNIDYADLNDKAFNEFLYSFQVYSPISPVWAK